MPTTTKTTTTTAPRLHEITLAIIDGDKPQYLKVQATSHAAALQAIEKSPNATARAYYSPFGDTLPIAAMHITVSTLSGIVKRGAGDVPRQQRQLDIARYTLRAMVQHGANAITIPQDITDYYQTAALALINHTAPLATVEEKDIAAAYSAAMSAVQKAYRAETRGVQQAAAGDELPRLYGSPTMRNSTPRRAAPQEYKNAIEAIKAAYIAQARDKATAERVFDFWTANAEMSTRDMAYWLKLNQSNVTRRLTDIRRIALALYPHGVKVR